MVCLKIFTDVLCISIYFYVEWHHYDLFVFPREKEHQIFEGSKSSVWSLRRLWQGDDKDGLLSAMARRCLFFYLEPYKKILLQEREFPEGFEVYTFAREVKRIYSCHRWPMVENSKTVSVKSVNEVCKSKLASVSKFVCNHSIGVNIYVRD